MGKTPATSLHGLRPLLLACPGSSALLHQPPSSVSSTLSAGPRTLSLLQCPTGTSHPSARIQGGAGTVQAKLLELGTQEARETTAKGQPGYFSHSLPGHQFSLQMTPFWADSLPLWKADWRLARAREGASVRRTCHGAHVPGFCGTLCRGLCFLSCGRSGDGIDVPGFSGLVMAHFEGRGLGAGHLKVS